MKRPTFAGDGMQSIEVIRKTIYSNTSPRFVHRYVYRGLFGILRVKEVFVSALGTPPHPSTDPAGHRPEPLFWLD